MKRFSRWSSIAWICLAFMTAVGGPFLVARDPLAQDLERALEVPSAEYPLGTDHLGRSVLSRVVYGARSSLLLAVVCVGLSVCLGTLTGLAAGLMPGFVDTLIMGLVNGLMAFPGILLAMVLAGTIGNGTCGLILALVLTSWYDYCRIVRNMVRSILAKPYIEAGRLLGFDNWFLMRRYISKQLVPQVLTLASLSVGRTVLNVSSLGFLGIGLRPPTAEWGAMITQGLPYLQQAPHLILIPGGAIFFTVLSFQLLAGHSSRYNLC